MVDVPAALQSHVRGGCLVFSDSVIKVPELYASFSIQHTIFPIGPCTAGGVCAARPVSRASRSKCQATASAAPAVNVEDKWLAKSLVWIKNADVPSRYATLHKSLGVIDVMSMY